MIVVRHVRDEDQPWIAGFLRQLWSSDEVIAHGEVLRPMELPGLIAETDGRPSGAVHFRVVEDACEIVSIGASIPQGGVGSALIEAVADVAAHAGCRRLWLITTNDNLDALRFYQRRGFHLAALHRGAVERSRVRKPEIPMVGEHGIPIRDEIELERILD